jgi:hypothetical protein
MKNLTMLVNLHSHRDGEVIDAGSKQAISLKSDYHIITQARLKGAAITCH